LNEQKTMNKREFIKTLTLGSMVIPLQLKADDEFSFGETLPGDEDLFWEDIRKQYILKPDYINLENGYYNILPNEVMKAYVKEIADQNREGSYYMRTKMSDDRIATRKALADFVGCSADELIVTRNTTESMDTVISGFPWKSGDEAIMAEQDYGSMLDMFKQQAQRMGIVNKVISIPLHPASDDEIVTLYEKAITPQTRMIMLCHMINITGQILPVRKICDMAHRYGVKVLVDGAHAIAHIDFSIDALNCDYYGSSLHKWLSVPLGAGLLYVRKENIAELWPLFGESAYAKDDIRKLNHTGTIPIHTEKTIVHAIAFQQKIGIKRKEARLKLLQDYWSSKVRELPHVVMNTPAVESGRSAGIANVGIKGVKPADLAKRLLEEHKIYTVAIDGAGVHGCRITPNVYTSIAELDALVSALKNWK
jgi:selenocysteine lyase/cysteine desulfurase